MVRGHRIFYIPSARLTPILNFVVDCPFGSVARTRRSFCHQPFQTPRPHDLSPQIFQTRAKTEWLHRSRAEKMARGLELAM